MRFPGYEEEWDVKELGNVAEIARGKSKHRPRDAEFLFGGEYPFIQTGDIRKADIYLTQFSQTYSEAGLKQSKLWDENTLCITIAANIAETAILKIRACFPDSVIGLIPKENETTVLFVKHLFDRFKIQIQGLSQGVAQDNLNQEKLSKIEFSFPKLAEQQQITTFLTIVDERISTQSKIIEKYESLIKVLKEAIFSQKIRFTDCEGEWTTYRVSDFLEFFSTNSLSWEQLEYGTDNIYNLHYGLIHQSDSSQINLTKHILPNIKTEFIPNNYSLCQDGDIAFADASEDTDDVAKSVEFFNCNNNKVVCGLHTIHGRDKLNITIPGFKGYAFSSKLFHHQVRRLAQGTKVFSISSKTFDNIYIDIPSKEEQSKIANFLLSIDTKIQIEKNLLDRYKKQKSYFLHELFL